jgi:hypothetical protein
VFRLFPYLLLIVLMRMSKIVDERVKKCQSGSCHTEVTVFQRLVDSSIAKPNMLILKDQS